MAYVLGFWYADGHMRYSKSYRIYFTSKDIEHLLLIRNLLSSSSPVVSSESKFPTLVVRSKKLYKDLENLGGIPRKSIAMCFPKIPEMYLQDFIRGYFDGDGSVYKIKYKSTKNGSIRSEIRSNFTCGNREFLENINTILNNKLGVSIKKIGQYGPHQFKLGYGQKDTYRLLTYLYYPNHIGSLDRKARYLDKFKDSEYVDILPPP